jgi:hypothetical protein
MIFRGPGSNLGWSGFSKRFFVVILLFLRAHVRIAYQIRHQPVPCVYLPIHIH